jgi:energy-converting hydrogenase Eha subunit H
MYREFVARRQIEAEELPIMSIIESLKAQLKTLEVQRREHEKAANAIRRNEVKIRKALSSVASLPAAAQS